MSGKNGHNEALTVNHEFGAAPHIGGPLPGPKAKAMGFARLLGDVPVEGRSDLLLDHLSELSELRINGPSEVEHAVLKLNRQVADGIPNITHEVAGGPEQIFGGPLLDLGQSSVLFGVTHLDRCASYV